MPDSPYTQSRQIQYRGPSTSDDYNTRIEENYKDLVVLYNRARTTETNVEEFYDRAYKEQLSLIRLLEDLEERIKTLEGADKRLTFYSTNQVDVDRFNGGTFDIPSVSRCYTDVEHGVLTLPRVTASSLSKLYFTDNEGRDVVPSTLELRVVGDANSADSPSATVETTSPELSVIRRVGRIWERSVSVDSPDADGAIMTVYLKIPTDLFTTEKSNVLLVHGFPAFGTDLLEVAYTTKTDVLMQEIDGYTVLNSTAMHSGNNLAVGWAPPGGWAGDIINDAGPKAFYFDPKPVTGVRLKIRRRAYAKVGAKFIYSYGLSQLDLRYDKFLTTGKTILRFDAPSGQTISSVTGVQPQIWNTAEASWSKVFSHRVIWETSFNSGTYTTTPVPNSKRVWVEVTLNETTGKGTPALSGMTLTYT